MVMIYIVILTSVLGTKVSGRNLGVLLMWAIWLFFLVACANSIIRKNMVYNLSASFFGDWIQTKIVFFSTDRNNKRI